MIVKLFKNNDSFIIKSFFFITLIAILKIPLNELSDLLDKKNLKCLTNL